MLWYVKVRDKVYKINASSNRQARWVGVQKYLSEHFLDITASLLYQYASCYKAYGRKGVPF